MTTRRLWDLAIWLAVGMFVLFFSVATAWGAEFLFKIQSDRGDTITVNCETLPAGAVCNTAKDHFFIWQDETEGYGITVKKGTLLGFGKTIEEALSTSRQVFQRDLKIAQELARQELARQKAVKAENPKEEVKFVLSPAKK